MGLRTATIDFQEAIRNGFHDVADVLEGHGAVVSPATLRKFLREAVEAGDVEVGASLVRQACAMGFIVQ